MYLKIPFIYHKIHFLLINHKTHFIYLKINFYFMYVPQTHIIHLPFK